jgi:serine phosphatase RsbU (regulator of sigma subunit)
MMESLQSLGDNLTLDEVASLTDADIVRRRFDMANVRWVGALSVVSLFVAISQLIRALVDAQMSAYRLPLAIVHVLVAFAAAAFFGELAYWQRRRGAWKPRLPIHLIARNLTPWVLAFFVAEFTLLTFFRTRNTDPWLASAIIFPWLVVPIRLEISRRFALHVSLLAVVALNVLILGTGKHTPTAEYTTIALMSAFSLLFGAMLSRRLRNQTLQEWTARRAGAREQVRMRNELQYARDIQLSMLPQSSPAIDWVDVAGTSLPATEVGGDYYDYFVDHDSIVIVCADVAGHGLGSGIVLASLRSGFILLRDALRDPAAVLQRLGDLVAQTSRRRMLATAAVVRLDRTSHRAIIASAGHPPVIVRRSGKVEAVELFAPPLGVRLPYRVPSREMAFNSGDVFVVHSDGVYESQNAAGEIYGLDRLASMLSSLDHAPAAEIRDAILRDLEVFRGGTAQADDVTLVVARVN